MTAERTPPTDGPRALLAEARGLSDAGHPAAPDAWRRLDEALRHTGTRLPDAEHAELLDHRAMALSRTEPAAAVGPFGEAAALYAAAGLPGEAVACRARALLATAYGGDARTALDGIAPLCSEAVSLHAAGRAATRHATAVLLTRARIRAGLLHEADDPPRAAADLDAELAELIAFAGPHRDEPAVLARIADATESRGRLARQRGDLAAATGLLAEAVRLCHAAGRPWQATEAELTLARIRLADGAADRAEALIRDVLADPRRDGVLDARVSARLHLTLADALAVQQRGAEAAAAYGETARLADAAGDSAGLGAYARLRLGGWRLELGEDEAAAAVLHEALPGLLDGHDDAEAVQARTWLGEARARAGDHAAAAEQFLLAAATAEDWADRRDHAALVHLAADALAHAGRTAEAGRGYERAGECWRQLGETGAAVGALRSRAWLAMREADRDGAIALMARALRETESGLGTAEDGERRTELLAALGLTYRQTAELLVQTTNGPPDAPDGPDGPDPASGAERRAADRAAYQEALVFTDHAVTAFARCGAAGLYERTGAVLGAAWLELALGRPEAAADRARTVLDAFPEGGADPDGDAAGRRAEARQVLERARAAG